MGEGSACQPGEQAQEGEALSSLKDGSTVELGLVLEFSFWVCSDGAKREEACPLEHGRAQVPPPPQVSAEFLVPTGF